MSLNPHRKRRIAVAVGLLLLLLPSVSELHVLLLLLSLRMKARRPLHRTGIHPPFHSSGSTELMTTLTAMEASTRHLQLSTDWPSPNLLQPQKRGACVVVVVDEGKLEKKKFQKWPPSTISRLPAT